MLAYNFFLFHLWRHQDNSIERQFVCGSLMGRTEIRKVEVFWAFGAVLFTPGDRIRS